MVYNWKSGSHIKADPGKIGNEIQQIGNRITPEDVVKKAKSKKTELNKCFEWDDTKAAHAHRLDQARLILRMIVVVEEKEGDENNQVTFRAYENITTTDEEGSQHHAYIPISEALADKDFSAQVMGRLIKTISEAERIMETYDYISLSFKKAKEYLQSAKAALVD